MPWILCLACLAAPGGWQVRYAQPADQKPEWDAAGYSPGFALEWADRDRPELTWLDAEDGRHRGILFLARPYRLPQPAPADLRCRLEYHTACTLDTPPMRRSGELAVVVLTPAAWESLAAAPEDARPLDPRRLEGLLAYAVVHPQGDDAPDWRAAEVSLGPWLAPYAGQDAWIGVAWSAAHFADRETGGLRGFAIHTVSEAEERARFWRALDLDRPALAAVRAAVEAGDEPAAEQALADYLRTGERPRVDSPVQPADARGLERARETLAHTYRLVGAEPYTFDGPIVWNADPFHYDQWAIALNRHIEWLGLAAAHLATGDEAYAREWAAQVVHWNAAMPVLLGAPWVQGPYNHPQRKPLSLDAGIRLGQTWFQSFEVFRHSIAVGDAALVAFVRGAWRHGEYLMRPENFHSGSNWGCMEANGLYHLGVLLPEFQGADAWRRTAEARLLGELTAQVYPDGTQMELAPGYHGVSLGNFLGTLELARANELPLTPDYEAGLERMFDAYARASLPDRTYPPLNDSGRGSTVSWLRRGLALFGRRDDWRWLATAGDEGAAPAETSLVFPYAGWVVFRSSWRPDAAWMLFDAGPFGAGHQHEDKLSLLLYAKGALLLTECGNYAYDDSPERAYALSTRGHNTVRVDGFDQNTRADRSRYVATAAEEHGFRSDGRFAYARETFANGYGPGADRTVTHRRRVLFAAPDFWIVADDLAARDDREHFAAAQFLLEADDAEVDPATGTVVSITPEGRPRLAIVPLAGSPTARVVRGQREPELLGWVSAAHRALREVPAALYELRFRGAATMAYALVPLDAEQAPPPAEAFGARISPTSLAVRLGQDSFEAVEPSLQE